MYARSTTITGDPSAMDEGITYIRDEVMPAVTAMDDCIGLSTLVDRESGECIVTSSWKTAEAMMASDPHLAPLRRRGGEIMGGAPQVEVWEVAVMHRDHPAPQGACCRVVWMRLSSGDIDGGIELYRSALLPEMETIEGFCSASLLVNRAAGRACSTTDLRVPGVAWRPAVTGRGRSGRPGSGRPGSTWSTWSSATWCSHT